MPPPPTPRLSGSLFRLEWFGERRMEVAGEVLIDPPLLTEQDFWVTLAESGIRHSAATAKHSRKKSTGREKTKLTCQASLFGRGHGNQQKEQLPRQTVRIRQRKGTRWQTANWESRPVGGQAQGLGWEPDAGLEVPSQGPREQTDTAI